LTPAGSWTCIRCRVRARFQPGTRQPAHPIGWAHEAGEWRCLACRRAQAEDTASTGTSADARALRRQAVTEFELLRDPGARDHTIARRLRCPTALVRPVRTALREAGKLPP
jgi:hypothetical protein